MPQAQQNKKFWNFIPRPENKAAELILYGDIASSSWWGDEITPAQFNKDLADLGDVEEIIVRINSGGGDVFAANAIYTRLKDHAARITVKIDGWAASAATIIAMAGDTIEIPANGVFMVHRPKMGVLGYYSEDEFVKFSEELKVIKQAIVNGYVLKTKKEPQQITDLMDAETWYTGQEAVDAGFCDTVMFAEVETEIENASRIIVNSVTLDLTKFNNIPQTLLNHHAATGGGGLNKNNQKKESEETVEIKTVDELRAAHPALVSQIEEAVVTQERNRIKNIEDLAIAGFEEVVKEAKFEKPIAAADVAMKIVAKQKEMGVNYLNNRQTDIDQSGISGVGNGGQPGTGGDEENPYDAAIDKLYPEKK